MPRVGGATRPDRCSSKSVQARAERKNETAKNSRRLEPRGLRPSSRRTLEYVRNKRLGIPREYFDRPFSVRYCPVRRLAEKCRKVGRKDEERKKERDVFPENFFQPASSSEKRPLGFPRRSSSIPLEEISVLRLVRRRRSSSRPFLLPSFGPAPRISGARKSLAPGRRTKVAPIGPTIGQPVDASRGTTFGKFGAKEGGIRGAAR
ncbi:hypothetical protein KM043_001621 [Ampulex compressa]|nr:hypothetical protein KM043_001621 [Ampulex compressa]